jgi:hypothetical protein
LRLAREVLGTTEFERLAQEGGRLPDNEVAALAFSSA